MKPSEPFEIRSNDRLAFVGKTGSGKTTAAIELAWKQLRRCVFYDPKRKEYERFDVPVLTSLEEVHEALFPDDPEEELPKFVYVPDRPEPEDFDDLCRLIYERRDTHLIADELRTIYERAGTVLPHHSDIMTQGRAVGVGMSNLTQRPKRVPIAVFSEAEHTFTFRLKTKGDRDRMEEIYGETAQQARQLDPYRYIYDHDRLDQPKVCDPLDV